MIDELKKAYPFINSKPFKEYTAAEFAEHLSAIQSHTARKAYLKKLRLAEMKERNKVVKEHIYVSFRVLPNGKGSITIRRRAEHFIYQRELDGICKEFPNNIREVYEAIARRKIQVREDDKT